MADNKHPFVVSDESVNRYGFRILTDGIDTAQFEKNPVMYYMHSRYNTGESKPRVSVIGRWENLRKENGLLKADPVFDEGDEFALEVKGKVDRGFLRMASVHVSPKEKSTDPKLLLAGQVRPTVTKSELVEISIVDRGGNNNALKLCNSLGELQNVDDMLPKIKLVNSNSNSNMSDLKTVALALKLGADASESDVLKEIGALQTAKVELADLKQKQEAAQKTEAVKLVDKLVEKKLIPETLKDAQLAAFDNDFEGSKQKCQTLLDSLKEENEETPQANQQLGDFITKLPQNGASNAANSEVKNFAWYEKHDPKGLQKLQAENSKEFEKLLDEHLKSE